MNKILLIHAGAIGDFILALPAIAALRDAYPRAQIEIIGHPSIGELARMAGYIDQVTSLEGSGLHQLFVEGARLPQTLADALASCDAIVSWFGSGDDVYSRALAWHAPQVIVAPGVPPAGGTLHAADYLLDAIRPILPPEYMIRDRVPRLPVPSADLQAAKAYLADAGLSGANRRLVAFHLGSGSRKKCWPVPRWVELSQKVGLTAGTRLLIIEGPADAAIVKEFDAAWHSPAAFYLRQRTLTELAAILACCNQYVGHDSGITHLASAVGIPVLALYGPTDPAIWGPRGSNVRVLHRRLEDLTAEEVFRLCW